MRRLLVLLALLVPFYTVAEDRYGPFSYTVGNPNFGPYTDPWDAMEAKIWGNLTPLEMCQQQRPSQLVAVVDKSYVSPTVVWYCVVTEPVNDCTAQEGQTLSAGYYDVGTSAGGRPALSPCVNGCQGFIQDLVSPAGSALVDGVKHYYAQGTYVNTGTACAVTAESPAYDSVATMPEDTCAAGQQQGTVNGKTVCINKIASTGNTTVGGDNVSGEQGTSEDHAWSIKVDNPDGTTTDVYTSVHSDLQGKVTTTTTTTTRDGDGNLISSKTVQNTDADPAGGSGGSGGGSGGTGCEANPMQEGCGGDGAQIPSLYEAKPTTLQQVVDARKSELLASPVGEFASSFFNVSSGGGQCPTWQATIPFVNATVVVDQFCAPFLNNNLGLIRAVVLCCAAFFAFRIAME